MENETEPFGNFSVALQTDDESQETVSHDLSEEVGSPVLNEESYEALHVQDQQDTVANMAVEQGLEQNVNPEIEKGPDIPGEQHNSQVMGNTGDLGASPVVEEHIEDEKLAKLEYGIDPDLSVINYQGEGNQTPQGAFTDLSEPVQEDAMQESNIFQEDDKMIVAEQSQNPKLEKKSDVPSATATVKVVLSPDGQVVTIAFSIGKSVGNLKSYFASQMKIPESVIQIIFEGGAVEDHKTLVDLGIRPHGTMQLEMQSLDPVNYPIKAMTFQHEYSMPDVITVRMQTGEDTYQDIAVEIERLNYHKPYLGGYRHKVTGVVYYHAGTQTVPKKRPDRGIEVFCRDTQTVFEKNKITQSRNTMATQMTKIGCYVANITDKLVQPRKYTTADEYHARRLKATIVIQTYFRRFHAKKMVEQLKEEKRLRLEWEEQEVIRKKKEKEERILKDYQRRMNPKNKEDFELLYHALESWRKEELERINQQYTGAERKAALCSLLEQETQLISSIGRHKTDAGEENQQKAIQSLLSKCCEPKKWKAFDGKTTVMDTQFTIRARELRDIYNSINARYFARDERLDALLTLKHTVKEHDCKLTQEIVELIDREADLLMRGVQDNNLEGLRKRISTLFLQYIKIPTFNPEIARLLKVPQDPTVLQKNIYFCPSCKSYLPSTEFSLSANARTIGRCRKCSVLDNEGRQREDFSNYRTLLKNLKKSEMEYGDNAKIAFVLQQEDLQYLVEKIWAAQSALSASDDLYDLVMVRWDKYYEWSPWNCILLTKNEASAHLKLGNAEQAYGIVFIRKIKYRHTLAKNYFSQILEMAPFLQREQLSQMSAANDLIISKPKAPAFQI
ncbi:IQ motif and ubiquitin-like domain-containing protein [Gastrophryne carolinensis]